MQDPDSDEEKKAKKEKRDVILVDQNYKYTTFIDEYGKMGLIDREGKECIVNGEAVRFTFIGPFVAGRARVCIGGELDLVTSNSELP